jgi:hypothetical protein
MLESTRLLSLRKKFWGEGSRSPIAAYEFKLIVVSGPATARHMSSNGPNNASLRSATPLVCCRVVSSVSSLLSHRTYEHIDRQFHEYVINTAVMLGFARVYLICFLVTSL